MRTEICDRGRLNHITTIPPSTTNPQWVQNDCMVISWIINNIGRNLVEYFLDYITSAWDLWTRIHFILGSVSLPPIDETIQREVTRRRSMVEKTLSEFNPSENPKPDLKQTRITQIKTQKNKLKPRLKPTPPKWYLKTKTKQTQI